MAMLADVHFKVDLETKREAEKILERLGISMSTYLNMAMHQLVIQKKIPFEVVLDER